MARQYERDLEEQGNLFMERLKKMAEEKKVPLTTLILKGEISTSVAKAARDLKADILVMGELKQIFSTTDIFYDEGERLFRRAQCPVLSVKDPERVDELYNASNAAGPVMIAGGAIPLAFGANGARFM
jgi:nucleotide-binding universal stress UspA family protein